MRKSLQFLTSTLLGQQYAAYDITQLLKSTKIYLYMYVQTDYNDMILVVQVGIML